MILKNNIVGKHILLRTALEKDAEFILKLRLDPELNKFLHKTDSSVIKQRTWIAEKKNAADDYHMIIQSLDGKRLGVVALYDIDWKKKTFDWGRWVISKGALLCAAGESMALVYHFAFNVLRLELALIKIYKDNKKVIAFHKGYGASEIKNDDRCVYFRFSVKDFDNFLNKYDIMQDNSRAFSKSLRG